MLPPAPLVSTLISQEKFDAYSERWLDLAQGSDPAALHNAFFPADQLLTAVSFPVQDVLYLLSAIDTVALRAQFVVYTSEQIGAEVFSLVLYGLNSLNTRTTAYFLANLAAESVPVMNAELPDCLAAQWLNNWQLQQEPGWAVEVDSALFATAYGPLRAYTFPLTDFLDTLRLVKNVDDTSLYLSFALHRYYGPSAAEAPAAALVFGTVVSTRTSSGDTLGSFYDLTAPCPPTC